MRCKRAKSCVLLNMSEINMKARRIGVQQRKEVFSSKNDGFGSNVRRTLTHTVVDIHTK